jgi:hypothetical protein
MEGSGKILLDGTSITDGVVDNNGEHILQETSLRNWFDLEENGSVIVEDYQTNSIIEKLVDEENEDTMVLEDATESARWIKDSGIDDTTATLSAIMLESSNIIISEGQIPFDNLTLNSSRINFGLRNIVKSADIKTRDTGDLALEDATDTTHGYLVLNSTSGSSTNAGENIRFEGGTARVI